MQSRGVNHGGEFALAGQTYVAEQSGGTMRELIEKSVDPVLDLGPVCDPAMHLEDILAQPAPQLLDRVEPRGIGRQPDRDDSGVVFQGGQYLGMRMDVPIILD